MCITADGWSKKGLTSAHFCVTVHFVSKDGVLRKACFALPEFPPPYTAAAISQLTKATLLELGNADDVPIIITDHAAAMIAAFKQIASDPDKTQPNETDDLGSSSETLEVTIDPSSIEDNGNQPVLPDHVEEEVNFNSPTVSEDDLLDSFCSLDDNADHQEEEQTDLSKDQVEREIDAADKQEENLNRAFRRDFGQ